MKSALCLVASLTLLVLLSLPVSAQSNCTTQWNDVLRHYVTRCSDGSIATDSYNSVLHQWNRTIRPAPDYDLYRPQWQQERHCVTKYNQVLRQWTTTCD